MPAPAILGLPSLIGYIGSAVAAAFVWIIERLTKRVIVFGAAMVSVVAAMNSLYGQFAAYIQQLALSLPPDFQSAGMILPSNTGTCITLIISAHIAALAYRFTLYIVKTKMDLVN